MMLMLQFVYLFDIKFTIQIKMLKKSLGISRNRCQCLAASRLALHKKKNRFKYVNEEDVVIGQSETSVQGQQLLCDTTRNSSSSQKSNENHNQCLEICQEIKDLIRRVADIRKKMALQAKARYSSFKQSQTKKKDQNICIFSKEAVQHILKAQKNLNLVRKMSGKTQIEEKYYRNMEISLAQQIRQASKNLRNQEKQYFQKIKAYQKGTVNFAIQLNQQDRQKMRSEFQQFEIQEQMVEEDVRSMQINELIKSINQLTTVYRELNDLVINQGSLIDRIDFNIQETFTHVKKGNQHLQHADEHAQNSCATKCIFFLMTAVIIMAIVLGFKYSSGKN